MLPEGYQSLRLGSLILHDQCGTVADVGRIQQAMINLSKFNTLTSKFNLIVLTTEEQESATGEKTPEISAAVNTPE
jgi:hypothetical protein